eukprot:12214205-Prorocentrum_lima.AAC.1
MDVRRRRCQHGVGVRGQRGVGVGGAGVGELPMEDCPGPGREIFTGESGSDASGAGARPSSNMATAEEISVLTSSDPVAQSTELPAKLAGLSVLTSSDPEEMHEELPAELAKSRLAFVAFVGMLFRD